MRLSRKKADLVLRIIEHAIQQGRPDATLYEEMHLLRFEIRRKLQQMDEADRVHEQRRDA